MSATDLAVTALKTFGDTQDGKLVDETFDLTGDSLEELQNVDLTKANNDLFNSLIDGKSADKRKLNGDGTILSVVQNVTTVWALQAGEYVPHVYIGTTGTWTDNLGGDVDANWEDSSNLGLYEKYLSNLDKIENLFKIDYVTVNNETWMRKKTPISTKYIYDRYFPASVPNDPIIKIPNITGTGVGSLINGVIGYSAKTKYGFGLPGNTELEFSNYTDVLLPTTQDERHVLIVIEY